MILLELLLFDNNNIFTCIFKFFLAFILIPFIEHINNDYTNNKFAKKTQETPNNSSSFCPFNTNTFYGNIFAPMLKPFFN